MNYDAILILILEGAFALLILYFMKLLHNPWQIVAAAVLIIGAFVIRGMMLSHETLDYQDFLTVWVSYFREYGGWSAIAHPIGNYNVPYLYFLALFSYSGIKDLFLIKLLSIFFDILLAWAAVRIVEQFTDSNIRKLCIFFIVLYLPTVALNGSYWGQCDSIYAAFALFALGQGLRGRSASAIILFACAFSFKLQAVFILPVILVLLVHNKCLWWHLLLFPATYAVLILPAVLSGFPAIDAITLYFDQMDTVGSGLNYNSPSVYSLFGNLPNQDFASEIGIIAAAAAVALILLSDITSKRKNDPRIFSAALIFVLIVPFLLPHMHERYFFLADIISVIAAFISPWYFGLPILVQFASLLGYHAYLKGFYLYPMSYGAIAMIVAISLSLIYHFITAKIIRS